VFSQARVAISQEVKFAPSYLDAIVQETSQPLPDEALAYDNKSTSYPCLLKAAYRRYLCPISPELDLHLQSSPEEKHGCRPDI
jgi:hypothetical protein